MKRYKAQFSKGWQGAWEFDALNDMRAWETVRNYIDKHTQTVYIAISEIWELDDAGNAIRKIDDYEEYFIPYKIYFDSSDCILKIYRGKDDFLVWNEAIRTIKERHNSEINRIEQLEKSTNTRQLADYAECKKNRAKVKQKKAPVEKQEEQEEFAVYEAHFSDGERSAPYIARVSEKDIIALDLAERKLKQHVDYNGLDIRKLKITKVKELNENMFFAVNLSRIEKKKNRCLALKTI
jgi:hypothetical protein